MGDDKLLRNIAFCQYLWATIVVKMFVVCCINKHDKILLRQVHWSRYNIYSWIYKIIYAGTTESSLITLSNNFKIYFNFFWTKYSLILHQFFYKHKEIKCCFFNSIDNNNNNFIEIKLFIIFNRNFSLLKITRINVKNICVSKHSIIFNYQNWKKWIKIKKKEKKKNETKIS